MILVTSSSHVFTNFESAKNFHKVFLFFFFYEILRSFSIEITIDKQCQYNPLQPFSRSWHISTTPNTSKIFLIIFKLLQQSNMVILSCLAKKNWNLNSRKKSSLYYWKGRFVGISGWKTQLSVINWTFFPGIQILIFLRKTTQNDHNRLLYKFEMIKKNLVVLGVVDMCQLLLITNKVHIFWEGHKIFEIST